MLKNKYIVFCNIIIYIIFFTFKSAPAQKIPGVELLNIAHLIEWSFLVSYIIDYNY